MLYRSTDRRCRCGAPMVNLAHSASFHACWKTAPSNPGIKHLDATDAACPDARGGAERVAIDDHRRGQNLIAVGQAPFQRETLAQSPPKSQAGPAGEAAVQRGEGNARE